GPPAESLSLCSRERESNQRESAPDIRPRLRRGSLLPVPLRGPSRRDVPVPSFLARRPASRPPAQHLHSASCRGTGSESLERLLVLLGLCFFLHEPTGATNRPFQEG